MKIAVVTEEEYVYLFPAWQETVRALKRAGHEVSGIWLVPATLKGRRGWRIPWWYLTVFGLRITCRLAGRTLVARFRAGRGFLGYAQKEDLSLFRAPSPNAPALVDWVRSQNIDVVFMTQGQIVKAPLLGAVRRAVINKHSALLPAYRGLLPVFWTMLDQVLPIAVTAHVVNEEIDAGRSLAERVYPGVQSSLAVAYARIYHDMPGLFLDALTALDQTPHLSALPRQASYRSLPTRADVKRFLASGHRFV